MIVTHNRSTIGYSPKRREDYKFLTGEGRYLDDLRFEKLVHAVILRSPHAHAYLRSIDSITAETAPGVLAILTHEDADADGLKPLRPTVEANTRTGEPFAFLPQPVLARDKVRFVGEPVAVIVAETKAQAMDAAELIDVRYDDMPVVIRAEEALATGAPELTEVAPGNLALDWRVGDEGAVATVMANATHVVRLRINNHRVVTNPMEPRGVVGTWNPIEQRYVLHVSSQNLHINRDNIAKVLNVPPAKVRFIAPDVGGGFGAKNFIYAEQALIAWVARRTGRPVKWIASRTEVFLADHQARDHLAEAELALNAEGQFVALRVRSIANLGAYMAGSSGAVQTYQYAHLPGTVYAIPAIQLHVRAAYTNTAPIGVTRGPGFAEANAIIERLIDKAARQVGIDRFELRRRNMFAAKAMPCTNAMGESIDSGAFVHTIDQALAAAKTGGFPTRKAASEARGCLRGLGLSYHIKGTGGAPFENVDIRFEADDRVTIITGTQTIGQGHETTFPQILADKLGLDDSRIHILQGDTDLIISGGGHGSSRSTYMGGTAMWRAAEEIIAKGIEIAADALEATAGDIRFVNGRFEVAGTDRSISLLEVAAKGREDSRPLDTYHYWERENLTFPNGAHVVELEIECDTGRVRLDRYTAVDDYGVMVNPMVVAGQVHGAIAQGVGQGLLEFVAHDQVSGQPLNASFMDYAMPRADDLPSLNLWFNPSRCTTNPLGVKGCGEAGAIAAPVAIQNAIIDALAPFGVINFDGPATPERVWRAMRGMT
jgi:carbon-monoxide dehydrogenase large subunit